MRSRGRFCVFCHLSQIAESERRFSFSMSINALIEFARARARARYPISGKIGFMRSIGFSNRSNAPSNARLFRRVMDSGIVVVVVWLMKTNEKRDFA